MKNNVRITGILFLTALAASLAGGSIIESVLSKPDYLQNLPGQIRLLYAGTGLELLNSIAVIGIAMTLYPVIKKYREDIGIGYVSFRIIESLFCMINAVIPLLLITLAQGKTITGNTDFSANTAIANLIISVRMTSAGLLVPVFFSLGALLLYYTLFRTLLVPRYISVWGLAAIVFLMILNLSGIRSPAAILLALPIILNEIYLGIWLIVKGFNAAD